jgi:MFS family permease
MTARPPRDKPLAAPNGAHPTDEASLSAIGPQPAPVAEPALPRPAPRWSLSQTFAALRYPNYRLWFFGQMVSLVGTWMQTTAQGFLIFELTGSPVYLGYVGFAAGLPSWLFMLYGGVIADRVSRRNLMVITQSSMMVLALLLATLTFTGLVQPWHINGLAFLLGVANAFDAPARVSFLLELVDREDLTNAVALNGTMFNSATAVGPAVAGLTYALVGPAWCFILNAASFVAVIGALLRMRLAPVAHPAKHRPALEELAEGLRFVARHALIRTIMLMAGTTALFGLAFVTLLPAWSVEVLGGDATTNGLLQSARGVGALFAALSIASLGRFQFRGKLLTAGSFFYPAMTLLFSFTRWTPAALLVMVASGLGLISMMNLANAVVQTNTPDALRGRVVSVYTLTFFGLLPVGALVAGFLAENFGNPLAVRVGALAALLVAALVYWRVPQVRRSP